MLLNTFLYIKHKKQKTKKLDGTTILFLIFVEDENGNFNVVVPGSDTYGEKGSVYIIVPIFYLNNSVN